MNIVPTNVSYNYNILKANITSFKNTYSFIKTGIIGYSFLGEPIYFIKLGTGNKKVFYSASIHANEWITSLLLMKFIENYCDAYINDSSIYGYNVKDLFNSTSIFIAPMVNPDGVNLVTNNLNNLSIYNYAKSISENYPSIPFPSGWKANIQGVDLNLQFPAGWEKAKKIKYKHGFNSPAPRDFVGYGPLTEPESLAIYNFSLINNFSLILAFHTQGKEIYWKYQNYLPENSYNIAEKLSKASGYSLSEVPFNSSFAGYKDWFIEYYNKPGYTIEAGLGSNPLPISQFNEIYKNNEPILILGAVL